MLFISRTTASASMCFVVLWACSDGAACLDSDGDGFGASCLAGADCDDTNPLRTQNCDTVPPPDCSLDPSQTGCPCLPGTLVDCFSEDLTSVGNGQCQSGVARCVNSYFGLCEGEVVPQEEQCNTLDDDCDGIIDNGVLSPCGGCDSSCLGAAWGEADLRFEESSTLKLTLEGWLTLKTQDVTYDSLWVANTADNSVSRIELSSGAHVARYPSGGDQPTRIAVDYLGDVWVANRASEGQSMLSKIASNTDRCIDKNSDGLSTSSDSEELFSEADEDCFLFAQPVGTFELPAGLRALAVDGFGIQGASGGDIWIGLHDAQAIEQRDGSTGSLLRRVETPGFSPYDAIFDSWGNLWLLSKEGVLARIEPDKMPLEAERFELPFACFLLYGMDLDEFDRIVLSGHYCNTLIRFDPIAQRWEQVPAAPSPRGIASLGSSLWLSHTDGHLSRHHSGALEQRNVIDLWTMGYEPTESIGIAADHLSQLWIVSSHSGINDQGVVSRVDLQSGEVVDHREVGTTPHVQGDLIGTKKRGILLPQGSGRRVFSGCPPGNGSTQWKAIHLDALTGRDGSVEVHLRHSSEQASLSQSPFVLLGSFPDDAFPIDIDLPDGGVIELEVVLKTTGAIGAPRLKRIGVQWQCDSTDIF